MFLGLLGSGLVAWFTYSSGLFFKIMIYDYFNVLLIVELAVVILFSLLFRKLPPIIVAILYFVYSMINGMSLSVIFFAFQLRSIIWLFIASSVLFGGMALFGYITKKDLSNWRILLLSVLIIGLILSVINIFAGNSTLDIILDWVILFVFFGITAYDMNKIKQLQYDESLDKSKLHIYGAMELYLDFINIFLRVLSIFGKRRN